MSSAATIVRLGSAGVKGATYSILTQLITAATVSLPPT